MEVQKAFLEEASVKVALPMAWEEAEEAEVEEVTVGHHTMEPRDYTHYHQSDLHCKQKV